ncbi:MAG: hypothetical protein ACTSX4_08195 [Candidatus Helarchaeota archaeon]
MQSNDLREIYKRLIVFARKEYRDKRPTSISGYLIKKIKGLSRTLPVLSNYLTRYMLAFFILSNFKDIIRIYFFTRDGTMVGAENINIGSFPKIEKELKKYAKKIFTIPHVSAEEMLEERKTPHYKKIKKMTKKRVNFSQLESKFNRTFEELKRLTSLNGKKPSITLTDSNFQEQKRFLSKKIKETICYSLDILNSDLLNGVIIRDCLMELIPSFFGSFKLELASYGAFLRITNTEKESWIEQWKFPSVFKNFFSKKIDFEKFFKTLSYILNFFDEEERNEESAIILIEILLNAYGSSKNLIAESYYERISDKTKKIIFACKRILFHFLEYKKPMNFDKEIDNEYFRCTMSLSQYRISEFRNRYAKLATVPSGLNKLYSLILETIKPFTIHQEIIKDERLENMRLFIKVTLKNKSDLIFQILDFKTPLNSNEQHFSLPKEIPKKIYPFEEKTIQIIVKISNPDQNKIRPLKIKIQDDSDNKYNLKSNSINLK